MENTVWQFGIDGYYWDHLHIRGEYETLAFLVLTKLGSPPHTWRIQLIGCKRTIQRRITSTYVENTLGNAVTVTIDRDHLHIRGEYVKINA